MRRWTTVVVVGVLALAGVFGFAQSASAAKPEPEIIEVDCGEDGTFDVTVSGNGQWTPAKIVGGGVFIPVAFVNGHGTFTDNEGNVEPFEDPDISKAGPTKKDFLTCHYAVAFEDENGSVEFEGDAVGFVVSH